MEHTFFPYGEAETEYLKQQDRKLAEVIEQIGHIDRVVDEDLFSAVIHHIIGQQISTKAQQSIWNRMILELGEVNAQTLLAAGRENIQQFGITYKKADYILDFAGKVQNNEIDLASLAAMPDDEVIAVLSSLRGIGVWTAEMILLFCLKRPNVFSYGDLAILRGMRMVYHHRKIDRKLFEKYRRRLTPYCSTASLYFWAVAGGAIPEMKDYAPKPVKERQNNIC
ncbi:MAG: DNA-3-methyladenine glycosylase 2 family protein [bacterium]|nr:DNA-3-methyladenine glycosylase 2 family protein [bacterium]